MLRSGNVAFCNHRLNLILMNLFAPNKTWLSWATCLASFFPAVTEAQTQWQVREHDVLGRILALEVHGEITPASVEILLEAVNAVPDADVRFVVLESGGGDLRAAMQMGRMMRAQGFDTVVREGASCFSACVFLLAVGIDKTVDGRVGIHRPYFVSGDPVRIADEIRELKALSEKYFGEMNSPERLSEDMFSVDPGKMRILTLREMEDYRLNTKDFVAQETDIMRMAQRLELTRLEYEALRKDMNYYCQVFAGQMQKMKEYLVEVSARHGVSMRELGYE